MFDLRLDPLWWCNCIMSSWVWTVMLHNRHLWLPIGCWVLQLRSSPNQCRQSFCWACLAQQRAYPQSRAFCWGQLQPSRQSACLHKVLAPALIHCACPRSLYMVLTHTRSPVQVLFHLQTRSPPVLPPLCELFQQDADALQARPLHAGQQPEEGLIEVSCFCLTHHLVCSQSIFLVRKSLQESVTCVLCTVQCSRALTSLPFWVAQCRTLLDGLARAECTLHCLQECEEYVQQHVVQYGKANRSSVLELLLSFFAEYAAAIRKWSEDRSNGSRQAACCQRMMC